MKYRIAIVDDQPLQLREICSLVRENAEHIGCDIAVSAFSNVFDLDNAPYDAYLLDIDMPGMGGIDYARCLRAEGNMCSIVFVSAMESAVFEAMRLQPLRFVRKSRLRKDMEEAMQALCQEMRKSRQETVLLNYDGGSERFMTRDILYVLSKNKHQQVIMTGRSLEVRLTMAELEAQLTPHDFLRVHRCYLVNMACVRRLFGNEIVLDNGDRLPVSRAMVDETRRMLGKAVMR